MKKVISMMDRTSRNDFGTYAMVIAAYIIVMILQSAGLLSNHMRGLLVPFCIYAIMAVSLNLVVGILGELSIGHAGFMCIGAFTGSFFSLMTEDTLPGGLRFFLALVIGAVMAGIFGFLIGIPVLRLKGDYLAIVTLAFGEIIKNIINSLYIGRDGTGLHFSMSSANELGMDMASGKVIVNGAQGITGTPRDSSFQVGILLLLLTLFVVLNLIHSRTGRAVMAVRDNYIAAESLGINITKYKMLAFTVSAAIAGVAGVLFSHNNSSLVASPAQFGYNMSIMILVYVVLGGIGSTRGAIIAAVLLNLIPEMLRFMNNYRMLIYSIVLIVIMLVNWNPASRAWIERHNIRYLLRRKNGKEGR